MSSNPLWTATLFSNSPRYEDWQRILGSDSVPLESPQVCRASLGDERDVLIYKLAIAELKPGQRERLVEWICSKFHTDHADVERELEEKGFPIREADVIVAYSMRAFI